MTGEGRPRQSNRGNEPIVVTHVFVWDGPGPRFPPFKYMSVRSSSNRSFLFLGGVVWVDTPRLNSSTAVSSTWSRYAVGLVTLQGILRFVFIQGPSPVFVFVLVQ